MAPFSPIFAFALTLGVALASPLQLGSNLVKELVDLPQGWTKIGIPSPTDTLKLSFALKQSNINGLISKLHEISNPKSPTYGQWLTPAQAASYSASAPETISTVKSWLVSNGISASVIKQPTGDLLQATVSIAQAELLLGAKYLLYSNPQADIPVARTLSYSLPANLHGLIDTVQPTTAFLVRISGNSSPPSIKLPQTPTVKEKRATNALCYPTVVLPNCVSAKYGVDYTGANRGGGQIGVMGGSTSANYTDANTFRRQTGSTAPGFGVVSVNGGTNSGVATGEGNLDTQIGLGMGPNNQLYYLVSPSTSDFFLDMANYLQSSTAPPSVSVSYGANEPLLSVDYMQRVCNLFASASAQGITVFAASGDDGVGGVQQTGDGSCTKFVPIFPANCPYVTAVGGTQFATTSTSPFVPNTSADPGETTANYGSNGGSGGGFSNVFPQLSFQTAAVQSYISKLNGTYAGLYNTSGRAYPDLSAISLNWYTVINGSGYGLGGTSSSAPAWAGLGSLLNDYRISQNKSKLGWLNPTIYQNPQFFTDITTGSGRGCLGNGFPAVQGWDAATGLGTPLFSSLRTGL